MPGAPSSVLVPNSYLSFFHSLSVAEAAEKEACAQPQRRTRDVFPRRDVIFQAKRKKDLEGQAEERAKLAAEKAEEKKKKEEQLN